MSTTRIAQYARANSTAISPRTSGAAYATPATATMAAAFVRRCGTSSVSNRSVYITKFVHDHVTGTNRSTNHPAPAADGSSARS
jgi:hypothetical protein